MGRSFRSVAYDCGDLGLEENGGSQVFARETVLKGPY